MNMKKGLFIVFIISLFLLLGCEAAAPEQEARQFKVINTITLEEKTRTVMKDTIKPVNLTVDLMDNYLFQGWKLNLEDSEYLDMNQEITITPDLVFYAVYEEVIVPENIFLIDEVARVDLTVGDRITSKEDYVNGTASIKGNDYELNEASMKIRLRGNSSLSCPKKSYKIKFDKKQNVFGFSNDKEWALIANYYDPSLMRNYYAYKLAKAMGMAQYVECKYVEVYLNGERQGLYLLVETVKSGSARIDIETDDDVADLPFLLELDFKMISEGDPASNGVEDIDFFYLDLRAYGGKKYPIACKYPKTYDSITPEQYESIKTRVRDAFLSSKTGVYDYYFDVDSLIDYFLIEELFMNIDVDHSSVFFYQPLGEKITFGPVWDFDISSGNCNYVDNYSPEVLMKDVNGGSFLFKNLLKQESFKSRFIERLADVRENILPMMLESFEENYKALMNYELADNNVWHNLFAAGWPKPDYLVGPTYYQQVIYLRDYLDKHAQAMARLIR